MPWDLAFDPQTGDLVRDDAGGWETTETADTAVLNQLSIHYGRWWADPALGSLMFDRDRFASDPAALVRAETLRALGLLVTERVIADLEVSVEESAKTGRVNARTQYRVVTTGELTNALMPVLGS